jgi:two-component system, NarL family, nitrate/nitrite response regulator NarL
MIADADARTRARIRSALSSSPDLQVVGEAADGAEALRMAAALRPEVALLDDSMPRLSGLEVMEECRRRRLGFRALLLTGDAAGADILKLLRCGGRGLIDKSANPAVFVKSVQCVHQGEVWIGRHAMATVVAALKIAPEHLPEWSPVLRLTRREQEVLRLVLEGDSNRGIAARLSVEPDTVKHHMTSIFNKTGMSNRVELAVFAMRHVIETAD